MSFAGKKKSEGHRSRTTRSRSWGVLSGGGRVPANSPSSPEVRGENSAARGDDAGKKGQDAGKKGQDAGKKGQDAGKKVSVATPGPSRPQPSRSESDEEECPYHLWTPILDMIPNSQHLSALFQEWVVLNMCQRMVVDAIMMNEGPTEVVIYKALRRAFKEWERIQEWQGAPGCDPGLAEQWNGLLQKEVIQVLDKYELVLAAVKSPKSDRSSTTEDFDIGSGNVGEGSGDEDSDGGDVDAHSDDKYDGDEDKAGGDEGKDSGAEDKYGGVDDKNDGDEDKNVGDEDENGGDEGKDGGNEDKDGGNEDNKTRRTDTIKKKDGKQMNTKNSDKSHDRAMTSISDDSESSDKVKEVHNYNIDLSDRDDLCSSSNYSAYDEPCWQKSCSDDNASSDT